MIKSCYTCLNRRMCFVHRWLMDNIQFDNMSTEYGSNFNEFFQIVSKNCTAYESDKSKI